MNRPTIRLVWLAAVLVAALAGLTEIASAQSRDRHAKVVPDGYIVVYEDSVAKPAAETATREREEGFDARYTYGRALKGFAAKLSAAQVHELRRDPEVAFVSPDRPVRALGSVALAVGAPAPTGIRRLEAASAAWTREQSGAGVAVLDSGVDLDHPDLNVRDGVNCVAPGAPADDDNGHGTHVAGTIGATNDGLGVVGVAPGTPIHSVKVLDAGGGGSWSRVICGINWVTSTRTDADPTNDIRVVNMSLGGAGSPVQSCATTTDALHQAICNSTVAGVTYVVAAGNDGWDFDYPSAPDVPAAYPEVLTVTAASDSDGRPGAAGAAQACSAGDRDDRYASFSNYALTSSGIAHTVAGPGVCIDSTWPGGGYSAISGTSMATPHVAGAVALCLDEAGTTGPCAGLTPAQIVQKMRTDAQAHATAEPCDGFTGDPLHPVGAAYFGHLARVGVTGAEVGGTARCQPLWYSYSGSVYGGTGHVSRLFEDDSSRLELSSVYSGGSYTTEVRPTAKVSPAQHGSLKKLTVEYDGHLTSSSASQTVRVWNFATGAWQPVSGPTTGISSDRRITWSNTSSPKSYVSSTGEIRLSVLSRRSGGSFRARTDLVRFAVEH